ncbi:MAG: acetylglutamate kinase [SAR202 cluster bacterium]|jgi:acetylglutamate kinase|nr:acetylglutamate kinase [SAR202 cluster bacterium]
MQKEPNYLGTTVVKIGGSTLGEHDTTLQDLAELQKEGASPVVVHGGGKIISDWMTKQNIRATFKGGLRVTDEASLKIVVAVLGGLINKELVNALNNLGARAVGFSGADAGMLRAKIKDPELGFVGSITHVDPSIIETVVAAGCIPVIAPVATAVDDDPDFAGSLLNINADTAAGEIAAALKASRLIFLTDVEGVMDSSRRLIPRITERQAQELIHSQVIAGGMIPKIEACLQALRDGANSQIIDGRLPGALRASLNGKRMGTKIG